MAKEKLLKEKLEQEYTEARRKSVFRALPLPSTVLDRKSTGREDSQQNDFQNSFQHSPLLGLNFLDSTRHSISMTGEEPKKHLFDNPRRHTLKHSSASVRHAQREQSLDKENRQLQKQAQRKSMIKQLESELNDLRKSVTR
jgi:hypothetical protein